MRKGFKFGAKIHKKAERNKKSGQVLAKIPDNWKKMRIFAAIFGRKFAVTS